MLLEGIDPKKELSRRKAEKVRLAKLDEQKGSIEQLFHSYTTAMKNDGRRTHKAVLAALEKEVYPYIAPSPKASDVVTHEIISVLANMIKRGAVTQSNRVRSYLMAAFNHGLAHDNDPANYLEDARFGLTVNPVAGIPKQKSGERVGEHYLTAREIRHLLHDMEYEFSRFWIGDCVRNLISLCFHTGGQRPYELAASCWEAVDWDARALLITQDVSKNRRPHLVPLTDSAMTILKRQYEDCGTGRFIFQHKLRSEEHMRLDSLSQAISRYRSNTPEIRPFIARDIRRTAKTLMGEVGINKSIRDRLQNHALNDVSSKHYDRYEYYAEKLEALTLWEKFLLA